MNNMAENDSKKKAATDAGTAQKKNPAKTVARDAHGRFTKGHAWAGGGMTLGQKKQLTMEASARLMHVFLDRLPTLPATLDRLEQEDPAKYATVMVSMAKFVAPQLQSQQIDLNVDASDGLEAMLAKRMKGGEDDDED